MTLELHPAIEAYFRSSNDNDSDGLLRAFAPDAIVVDEQAERHGHEGILHWSQEVHAKYRPLAKPLAVARIGEESVVTASVSGNFPGSPVDLRFTFRLEGERIIRLEINLA